MTNEQLAIRQHLSKPEPYYGACGYMGPQGNEPLCPCLMSHVEAVDGSYYEVIQHRSPDGITHTAKCLGPVGGPYVK